MITTIRKNLKVDSKDIKTTLKYFLTDHSCRKFNYLYWNVIDHRTMCLCLVNLTGKDLTRLNTPDLGFRIVKVLNKNDWDIVRYIFERHITPKDNKRAVSVVRLDYLLQYLERIKWDLEAIDLQTNKFGNMFVEHKEKVKPISVVENDIQCLYLIDRLYNKYVDMISTEKIDADIHDRILEDPFVYDLVDSKITIPMTDGLEIISRKFASKHGEFKLEMIHSDEGLCNVVNRYTNDKMIVVSVRVYLKYFLDSIKKRKRRTKNG